MPSLSPLVVLSLSLPLSLSTVVSPSPKAWAPLTEQLDAWVMTANFGVTVGNASGPQFEYTHGNFSLETSKCQLASTSKWPMAMMFVGLVNDGTIHSLDAKANEYVDWWTKDPKNPKSEITLRHLLSFTSGFGSGAPGQENTTETCMDDPSKYPSLKTYDDCAREIYTDTNLTGLPGHTYTYNSVHLQLAGSIAIAASKLSIQEIFQKYLQEPYGMHSTTCEVPTKDIPQLAICLETVGKDYGKFLEAQLTHSVLSENLVMESEMDYTPFLKGYTLYGNYGFGHFHECFDSVAGMTAECKEARIHMDPGALGYFPLIDRKNNFYMQIVANEGGKYYARSGIPEYLRFLAKPLVDGIMLQTENTAGYGHHTPSLNGASIADVNYIVGCIVDPASCE